MTYYLLLLTRNGMLQRKGIHTLQSFTVAQSRHTAKKDLACVALRCFGVRLLVVFTCGACLKPPPARIDLPVLLPFDVTSAALLGPFVGLATVRLALLAEDAINSADDLLPNTTLQLRFIDSECDVRKAIERMVDQDGGNLLRDSPGFIGAACSSVSQPFASIFGEYLYVCLHACLLCFLPNPSFQSPPSPWVSPGLSAPSLVL